MADGMHIGKHDVAEDLGLAAALSWLIAVPFCPAQIADALPQDCAVSFMGAFMLGCALYCLATAMAPARRNPPHGVLAFLLPVGTVFEMLFCTVGFSGGNIWTPLLSLAMGAGEGAVLLAWGKTLSVRLTGRMLETVRITCIGIATLTLSFGLLSPFPMALRALLVGVSLVSVLPLRTPRLQGCENRSKQASPEDMQTPGFHYRPAIGPAIEQLWEPVLGLGLSLMSAVLPWGSLITGDSASVPAFWSFAIGAALVTVLTPLAARFVKNRIDYDVAIHLAIPLLAATVVGLRLVGDMEETGFAVSAIKGVGSGAVGAGFLVCALVAMAREARGRNATLSDVPFALGFGGACLVGFAILPAHAVSQSAASLTAPFLSLAFLAITCCSSVIHIRRHTETQKTTKDSIGIEEAAHILAQRQGLSPREEQVLSQLVLGRSANGIGEILGISPNTVRSHVNNIHGKLGIQSRDQLADLIEQTQHESSASNAKEEAD